MMTKQLEALPPTLVIPPLEGFRILMPRGIIGFPSLKHYILKPILVEEAHSCFWRFESQDQAEISFILLESNALREKMVLRSSHVEKALEGINQGTESPEIFYIVTIDQSKEGSRKVTANIKAPVVVDPQINHAWQVILRDADYPVDYVL